MHLITLLSGVHMLYLFKKIYSIKTILQVSQSFLWGVYFEHLRIMTFHLWWNRNEFMVIKYKIYNVPLIQHCPLLSHKIKNKPRQQINIIDITFYQNDTHKKENRLNWIKATNRTDQYELSPNVAFSWTTDRYMGHVMLNRLIICDITQLENSWWLSLEVLGSSRRVPQEWKPVLAEKWILS